jgi:predicted AAA+ superfamily ATPase
LFPLLRVLVDRRDTPATFMILGSASPQLSRHASESLAGRVETIEVTPFSLTETTEDTPISADAQRQHWQRGGYPLSFLAANDDDSFAWRDNFIRQFLERDIPRLGITISANQLRRFWMMLAHYHGQTWNAAEISNSLSVSAPTTRHYLDILTQTFMIRQLQPWHENIGKRQVKAPKIYFRDSGIFHALMGIRGHSDLLLHPRLGASWEGYAVEEILRATAPDDAWFWSVHTGPELDLLCFERGRRIGYEIKYRDAPKLTNSMRVAAEVLKLDELRVVYPGSLAYPMEKNICAVPLAKILGNKTSCH